MDRESALDASGTLDLDDYLLASPVQELATTEAFLPEVDGHPTKFAADARFSRAFLAADDEYDRLEATYLEARSFGRNTIVARLRYGTGLGSEIPVYDEFSHTTTIYVVEEVASEAPTPVPPTTTGEVLGAGGSLPTTCAAYSTC